MGIKRVVAEIPPPVKVLCHHCHDQHNDTTLRNENSKWFCKMHSSGSCNYIGCFGKETVHCLVIKKIDPPGTVRSSGVTLDGKIYYSVTNPR